jgi:GNAT superfamily N-acetyltransferase
MSIDVAPLADPDLAYELNRAVWAHEVPDIPFASRATYVVGFRESFPGYRTEHYLGRLDGAPAGGLDLVLPLHDNLETADVAVRVLPGCRRRGLGRALHSYAVDRVRALGRKRLFGESTDHRADGGAFATAMGATAGLVETRSRLEVGRADRERLDALLAEAWRHADGYRVVRWVGVPPDHLIDDVAYLDSRFNTDSPMGELDVEPEKVDADRVRNSEQAHRRRGRTRFHQGAVHEATGRLVAWTTLAVPDDVPSHAWQNITLVDPDHRGHRLGLIIKIENLRYARRQQPQLQVINTFNASSNTHMLAINRTLGFRAVDAWTDWQQRL